MARSRHLSLFQFSMMRLLAVFFKHLNLSFLRYSITNTGTEASIQRSMMHIIEYPSIFVKFLNFLAPYFRKIYQFFHYFFPIYVFTFLLYLRLFFPYFDHDACMYASCFTLIGCPCRAKIFHITRFRSILFDLIVTKYEIYKSRKCTLFGVEC